MSTASPSAFLLWAILSVLFQIFLVYHLWCYDRFKCLHWSSGRQPGAFKRIMTYSYLCSVPLLAIFSIAMTVIKFKEGFIVTPEHQILPKPLHLYTPKDKSWILPLDFVFSAVWALELVTHLEELAFWLYLLHQNAHKAEWFSSWEYRLWYFGSVVAIVGLPLTTLITRRNLETCDAYIFLVGASGSTVTTICFLYVLWHFPAFIAHVKAEGADPTVVVRLATFYQLNLARIVFRFLFTIPLFILAMDGVISSPHIINHNVFSTDFLHMLGGIGCFVSTTITLLIFFPRSIVNEAGYRPKAPTIAASSPKTVNTESPNLVHSEYALQSYDGFGIASPEYVLDMQPEDVNIHYPYPHSLAVGSDRGAMSVSEETGDWDEDEEIAERGDDSDTETPPYPPPPELPSTLHMRRNSAIISVPSSPRLSSHGPIKSTTVPPSSPMRARISPTRNQERIETISFQPRTYLRRLQPTQNPAEVPPSPAALSEQTSGIHQRHTFPHSLSSPHILSLETEQASSPEVFSPMRPHRSGHHRRHSSRRISPGIVMQSPEEVLQGRGLGINTSMVKLDEDSTITLRQLPAQPRRGSHVSQQQEPTRPTSNLHPYVTTFTSPIDLADIPPREEFPRTT